MTLRKRAHLTAWLGLIAMWLIVFAPVVSQLRVSRSAHEPVAALCSAAQPDGSAHHQADSDAFGACGYCQLLQHHAAMPAIASAEPSAVLAELLDAAPVLSTRHIPLGAFPSGRPRDPPSVS